MRVIFTFVLFFNYNLFAQNLVTLQSCIEKAIQNNPQTALIPLINKASDLQVNLLKKNYLPQSALNGVVTWQSDVTEIPIKLPGIDFSPPSKLQYKITLEVAQNIWDGGLTKQQQLQTQASSNIEIQKINTDTYTLIEQVSNLYFAVLFANKQIENAELFRIDLVTKLNKTQNLQKQGLAITNNILAIQARLIELEQQINEAQIRQKSNLNILSLLIHETLSTSSILETPAYKPITNTDTILRPEIKLFEAQKTLFKTSEALIKAKNKIKISAFATGGLGLPGLNFLLNTLSPYYVVGIQAKMPLAKYYNNTQNIEIQKIKIDADKITQLQKQFELSIQIKTNQQLQEIEKIKSIIETDNKLIEIREKMRKTAEIQLDNGIITAKDYLIEANNVDIARENKIIHELQQIQATYNLQIILGY